MKIEYPLLIDGGLSNVLESFGCDLNNELWVAKLIAENPDSIIKTHLAYLEAGARVISTSSYQASVPGFMAIGYSENEAHELILKSVELAKMAKAKFLEQNKINYPIYIAASLGPYGAYLADGSEYKGNYGVSDESLYKFHKNRIEILKQSEADFFIFETVPSYQECKIINKLTEESSLQAWLSFSCKDEKHINDGTPISECAKAITNNPNIFAIGINCTAPKYVSNLIKELLININDKKIVVYPNSGEAYNAKTKTWMGIADPKLYVEMAKEWKNLGAEIIGGCCRIGPEHIQNLNKLLYQDYGL